MGLRSLSAVCVAGWVTCTRVCMWKSMIHTLQRTWLHFKLQAGNRELPFFHFLPFYLVAIKCFERGYRVVLCTNTLISHEHARHHVTCHRITIKRIQLYVRQYGYYRNVHAYSTKQ